MTRPIMGQRTKRKLKSRPKFKQVRRLKDRRVKAKKAAAHKRGLNRSKARKKRRGVKARKFGGKKK
jgi:hypothetical protein